MKKLIAIILALVLLMAGCSQPAAVTDSQPAADASAQSEDASATNDAPEVKKIGMVVMTLQAEFFIALTNGMDQKFDEAGYDFTVASYDGDASKAVSVIENYIVSGVDCIISMVQDASCDTILKKAMDQGIKVVTAGGETAYYDLCVKSDNADCGLKIAEMAADFINGKLDGKAKVAAFVVKTNANPEMTLRSNAMLENLLKLAPGAEVVNEFETTGNVGECASAMENFLQQNPDIKVVVSYGDQGGLEAMEVIKAAGKAGDDFGIFGCDATQQSLASIAEGGIFRGTVYMGNLVDLIVDNVIRLMEGDETLGKTAIGENIKVTAENVNDYLTK